jgi:hypothetical protein
MKKRAQLSPLGKEIEKFKNANSMSWGDIANLSGLSRQVISTVSRKVYVRTAVWNAQKSLDIPEWKFACLMFGVPIPEDVLDIVPVLKKLGYIDEHKEAKLNLADFMQIILQTSKVDPAVVLGRIKEVKKGKALAKLSLEEQEILGL